MTNENQQIHTPDHKLIPFGTRLKSAREALGLERKEAAAQLRLNEKIILMMEKDRYPNDMPITFIRGYLRAYGKLLQIPEYEIKKGLEPIKPKPMPSSQVAPILQPLPPVTSGNFFMQFFTYLVFFTLIGLVGMWWYSHPTLPTSFLTENQMAPTPETARPTTNVAPILPTPVAQAPVEAPKPADTINQSAPAAAGTANVNPTLPQTPNTAGPAPLNATPDNNTLPKETPTRQNADAANDTATATAASDGNAAPEGTHHATAHHSDNSHANAASQDDDDVDADDDNDNSD